MPNFLYCIEFKSRLLQKYFLIFFSLVFTSFWKTTANFIQVFGYIYVIYLYQHFLDFSFLIWVSFSSTVFNVGLCVTNALKMFIIPSHLNDNLAGYKSRLKVLLSFQYFKNITIVFLLLLKNLRSWWFLSHYIWSALSLKTFRILSFACKNFNFMIILPGLVSSYHSCLILHK